MGSPETQSFRCVHYTIDLARSISDLSNALAGEAPALALPDGTVITESTAIARYIDESYPGRKIMGETALEKALDQQWDQRIWVHMLYRLTTAFHVLHSGLGPDLELTVSMSSAAHTSSH